MGIGSYSINDQKSQKKCHSQCIENSQKNQYYFPDSRKNTGIELSKTFVSAIGWIGVKKICPREIYCFPGPGPNLTDCPQYSEQFYRDKITNKVLLLVPVTSPWGDMLSILLCYVLYNVQCSSPIIHPISHIYIQQMKIELYRRHDTTLILSVAAASSFSGVHLWLDILSTLGQIKKNFYTHDDKWRLFQVEQSTSR